jgi:hypothetical protein
MTHPDTRRLEVMEVFADLDSDPLEVWFQYEAVDSRELSRPVGFEVRFGSESRLRLSVQSWGVEEPDAGNASVSDATIRAGIDLAGVFDETN